MESQMTEQGMVESLDVVIDSDDLSPEDEQTIEGHQTGEAFAHKHIIGKMNIFMEEYRRNGYSEQFICGFINGINDVTGGTIRLDAGEVEEELDNPADSD